MCGRRIVLGVSGSIAAYKALAIASEMAAAGALIDVVLTDAAAALVTPLAFQAIVHRPVVHRLGDPSGPMGMDHVAHAHTAEALVVAPATAHVIARLALGLADDALTTTALACRAPLVVAPAMEPDMWTHPATQAHVATLTARGAVFVGPDDGRMASGKHGQGRLADPAVVVDHVRAVLGHGGPLTGRKVVVSAGPTREPIDPVRYLSNHSSGRMGYAVARAVRDRGADVVLISGPVDLAPPAAMTVVAVETARDMLDAVLTHAATADAVVMSAAVADHRPIEAAAIKLKRSAADLALALTPNPDILIALGAEFPRWSEDKRGRPYVRVGFAAETHDLVAHARDKLARKSVDLIVANPVPETFGGRNSSATFVTPDAVAPLGERSKDGVASAIADWIAQRLADML
ncbi:bifunctional phosphopantothenoylcysteine decarboxylase/phosphopantothenate--cysteine ligase CoaBC [bacterium]|nr:bifunctional phosphopantothenoylcysteine decarboxylase/phosphopantothenate--cysteine ligase CoaBC [Chloroflexi bacterium CFX6]RIL12698.1 MAG: bifunctional phosphopantothenoylcysteine decarboxylase/phosphopantothenate--cysteine ligase CoaBC [bacterium]